VYKNTGKYPMMAALGCNAGNLYNYDVNRFQVREGLSEKYVLAPDKGMIGFIAGTSFGVVHYLNVWGNSYYESFAVTDYGKPIGEIMRSTAIKAFAFHPEDNLVQRANVEQNQLHGDPAMKLNTHEKVDYAITDPMLKITPPFISVAENTFQVLVKWVNLGKTISKPMVVQITRQFPDNTSRVVYRDTLASTHFEDSVLVDFPIDAVRDKGTNKITVTIDALNEVDEFFESNNSVSKEFVIYSEEARPIYPYTFSIVNQQNVKLFASTANPLSPSREYRMEMDTTELFNSPLKTTKSLTSTGGVLEFTPGITMTNNTVYYWRVAPVPASGDFFWNTSSFVFLSGQESGFNQSHLYQHFKSTGSSMTLDSASRNWQFGQVMNNLFIKNAVWGTATGAEADLVVNVNNASYIRNTCNYGLIFNVFDKNTFKPWRNANVGGKGLYESLVPNCGESRMYNFEFSNDTAGRRKATNFLKLVPDGNFVVVRNQPLSSESGNQYVSTWINDATYYGADNTLYSELKKNNVNIIDSFYRARVFAAVYQKNTPQFNTAQATSNGVYDKMTLSADARSLSPAGKITSPVLGPAKSWKEFSWEGKSLESNSKDEPVVDIVGIAADGYSELLRMDIALGEDKVDISDIDASMYPYVQLVMRNKDTAAFTPYQLKYWKVTYDPVPEGAIAPNIHINQTDTIVASGPVNFQVAFKNVSPTPFADSLLVKMMITGEDNIPHELPSFRVRPLAANDTLIIQSNIDTKDLTGTNTLYLEVNPENDPQEQHHFNNDYLLPRCRRRWLRYYSANHERLFAATGLCAEPYRLQRQQCGRLPGRYRIVQRHRR
jgi:hypothetical protein